jgi:squalene cyclase
MLHKSGLIDEKDRTITHDRLADGVNVVLSFQNKDGGWATYENTRYYLS